ncbi:D-aminoacid aminotransferase-like PLP-dependent enzyme, partial [Aspergillus ellipticus CBS 707.79]
MILANWHLKTGWSSPTLQPYAPLPIMPNASVLHHATECFEGMKAYRGHDGSLRLFRPECNALRMRASAARVSLPDFCPEALVVLIRRLLEVDAPRFLPRSRPGEFLYLRPVLIGTHRGLGPQVPEEACLVVFATYMPVFGEGGIRVLASGEGVVRAWPGGFGDAKVGGNYGPALGEALRAKTKGFDQVLWLFGEQRWVTECGTSNFFVVWRGRDGGLELVTAPLGDGVILDGIMRRSVLQLVRERLGGGC